MTFDIYVTEEDIEFGERISCTHCPIALAARRLFDTMFKGKAYSISVASEDIDVIVKEKRNIERIINITLPLEAVKFIKLFDDSQPVRPFIFTVSL